MKELKRIFSLYVLALIYGVTFLTSEVYAQAGFNDDRIMLQGFYWESYRHGHSQFSKLGSKKWYDIVREKSGEISDARFNLIWLPPPSFAGEISAGYNPKEYFNLSNSYGNEDQHRKMLVSLLNHGIEPIADIVINHRDGSKCWTGFTNPNWNTTTITSSDEAFKSDKCCPNIPSGECSEHCSEVACRKVPMGNEEERPNEYTWHKGTTHQYNAFRDLDHTNPIVQKDITRYLHQLKSFGYRGWRYDMVHGYHAKRISQYNKASNPTFSVGEYDWDKQGEQRGWVWNTAVKPNDLTTSSSVFDFSTYHTLKDNKGKYHAWYGYGKGIGLIGDTTDDIAWKNRAVTFIKNHDVGYRTKEDGTPESGHEDDIFHNNWEVEQAYAYILTHPGVPTVFWSHYFDWGVSLREKLKALINARKVAGVHSGSVIDGQQKASANGVYAARIGGSRGYLYVRIGGSDADWQPSHSDHSNYREYATGDGWKVWIALTDNPEVQQAPLPQALPVPTYVAP